MNDRGFTIVEVVVSILVISVGALGIAKSTAGMTRMVNDGNQMTEASFYAQAQLERMRSMTCATLSSGSDYPTPSIYRVWTVTDQGSGKHVLLTTAYRTPAKQRADTLEASIPCV